MDEVRLAVVLYGGSSLAIYINGMVQELFKLVRATAVRPLGGDGTHAGPGGGEEPLVRDAELSGTERVYRTLCRMRTTDPGEWQAIAPGRAHAPLGTRVVVDILSGSSAGGINGVFLAKALVGDLSLDELKRLWVDEGDVKTLIYDAASRAAPRLRAQSPVPSLLNGRRLYRLLLQALEGMERRDSSGRPRRDRTHAGTVSPYVDELDLYITATDLQGLDQWLTLENTKAYERRHRNVFHFSYTHDPTVAAREPSITPDGTGLSHVSGHAVPRGDGQRKLEDQLEHHNDFHADNNPFLAFAARCTSSLPFVFEPMQLRDIESHLSAVEPYASNPSRYGPDGAVGRTWQRFYADYLPGPLAAPKPAADMLPFAERSFGDGGALDNSPFSYSIDRLLRAQASRRIHRKLLYVEPDPAAPPPREEDVWEDGWRGGRAEGLSRFNWPNPLRNTLLQVVSLPRYQTIREDLQRVQERNRLALRLQSLLAEIWPVPRGPDVTREAQPWVRQPFLKSAEKVKVSPQIYNSYIRLRAETVVQQLAILVTRAVGLDEESDDLLAMRLVVRAWRDQRYPLPSPSGDDAECEKRAKAFLSRFDADYRFRLVKFLQASLDDLHPLSDRGRTSLRGLGLPAVNPGDRAPVDEIRRRRQELIGIFWQLRRALRLLRRVPGHPGSPEEQAAGEPGSRGQGSPLLPFVEATGITSNELRLILSEPTPERQRNAAAALMANPQRVEAFDALGDEIARQLALTEDTDGQAEPEAQLEAGTAMPGGGPGAGAQTAGAPSGLAPEHQGQAGRSAVRAGPGAVGAARTIGTRIREVVQRSTPPEGSGISRGLTDSRGSEDAGSPAAPAASRSAEAPGWAEAIDTYLAFHRDNFDAYDVVALPLLYGTPLGEIDEVEVIRMSPREATSLLDEQMHGKPKLGGASVGHLGGFFYERWRRNDIMWGRLDAAECLIEALVPPGLEHEAVAASLRWEAHRHILEEELSEEDRQELLSMSGGRPGSGRDRPGGSDGAGTADASPGPPGSPGPSDRSGSGALGGITHEQASRFFRTVYTPGEPSAQQMMRNAGRGMHVTGKVLQGVAQFDTGAPEVRVTRALRRPTRWVALLGSLLTGMVEVAVAGPRHLIFRHVVASLFLFEVAMLGLGIVLGLPAAVQLGTTALAPTLLAGVAVWIVRIVVTTDGSIRRRLLRIGALVGAALFFLVVGLAILEVRHLAQEPPGPLRIVQCWIGRCPAPAEGGRR